MSLDGLGTVGGSGNFGNFYRSNPMGRGTPSQENDIYAYNDDNWRQMLLFVLDRRTADNVNLKKGWFG